MTDVYSHEEDMSMRPDIFIVAEDYDSQDFVSIDHSMDDLSDVVMIDMSQDEFFDVVDMDTHIESDAFVTLDDEQILTADFTDEDFNATIIDLDNIDDFE